jgi:hypothetical protein
MPSLGESSYCNVCWAVYATAAGHNCPGPRACADPYSAPNAGFATPENARRAALIFTAMGCTGDYLRAGKHPDDRLMHELAGEVDKIRAEGLTPDECRELIPGCATAQAAA